jgi:hypothetical protein
MEPIEWLNGAKIRANPQQKLLNFAVKGLGDQDRRRLCFESRNFS